MGRSCIKAGATGADVTLLPQKLCDLGYGPFGMSTGSGTQCEWPSAGAFGQDTHAAVEGFQRSSGLTVDGIAGPNTWAKLGESGDSCSSGGSRGASSSGALVAAGAASLPLVQRKWFLPVVAGVVGVGIIALLFVPKKGKKR